MSLIPAKDLEAARERYEQEQARTRAQCAEPKTKAEILCEICREDGTATVAELATAAERSPAWVRKILRQNGIRLTKPLRERHVKVSKSTKCARCGHSRGGWRKARGGGHCKAGTTHVDAQTGTFYKCASSHCEGFNLKDGVLVPCTCTSFEAPLHEPKGENHD